MISASALSRTVPVLASLVSAAACELFTSDIARQFGANYNRVSHVTCREGPGGWDRDKEGPGPDSESVEVDEAIQCVRCTNVFSCSPVDNSH